MKSKQSVETSITDVRYSCEVFVNATITEEKYPKLYWKLRESDGDRYRKQIPEMIGFIVGERLRMLDKAVGKPS